MAVERSGRLAFCWLTSRGAFIASLVTVDFPLIGGGGLVIAADPLVGGGGLVTIDLMLALLGCLVIVTTLFTELRVVLGPQFCLDTTGPVPSICNAVLLAFGGRSLASCVGFLGQTCVSLAVSFRACDTFTGTPGTTVALRSTLARDDTDFTLLGRGVDFRLCGGAVVTDVGFFVAWVCSFTLRFSADLLRSV